MPPAYGIDAADKQVKDGTLKTNHSKLPDALQQTMEAMSSEALDDVRVTYNSPEPMQLQAQAYTRGTEIHIAPGEEEHLPHEAWHVVQQKQGRVKPTTQANGITINADPQLEREAAQKGAQATNTPAAIPQQSAAEHKAARSRPSHNVEPVTQMYKEIGMLMDGGLGKELSDAIYGGGAAKYLNGHERQQYLVTVDANGLLNIGGNLMDTSNALGNGLYIFVMDKDGNIYAAPKETVGHHSAFLSGRPVAAAGHIGVQNGRVTLINNQSGHYQPTKDYMLQFEKELKKRNADLSQLTAANKNYGATKKAIKKALKQSGHQPRKRLYTPNPPQDKYY